MKKVLITGTGSFVGTAIQRHLEGFGDKYRVESVGTINGEWKDLDFGAYDAIYHVAGLAHADVGHVSDEVKAKYYAVNTDLTIQIARKARAEGAKQFIFMSSSIVYGDPAPIGGERWITRETPCTPANFYGDSKFQAEKGLLPLNSGDFKVVILRCPMIYGRGGRGNFITLEKMARRVALFPKVDNRRSILYVGNLAEFVRLMIENGESGVFWPCNRELINTSDLVRRIGARYGRRIILVPGFTWALKLLARTSGYINKAFGSLAYEAGLGEYRQDYRLYDLEQSIKETVG